MSNNTGKKDNDAVTGVEVVKNDTVVFEDGDFEEYNADHDLKVDTDATLGDGIEDKESSEDKKSDDDKSDKKDKSADDIESKDDKSDNKSKKDSKKDSKKSDSDKEENSEQDDKSGITMAGIYQWASKLKDDFRAEATDMTSGVTEKAAAMTLSKLRDAVDLELNAFDKSLEMAKKLLDTAEEQRTKIESRREKYQGMIDKLDK